METIASLTQRIRNYDRRIEQLSEERYPRRPSFRQVSGSGGIDGPYLCPDPGGSTEVRKEPLAWEPTWVWFLATTSPASMILKSGISGEGDEMLRRLVVSSAHYILGPFAPDSDLQAPRREDRHWWWQECQETCSGGCGPKARSIASPSLGLSREVYEPLHSARIVWGL